MLDQSYYQKADEIIAFYGKKPSSLIPVMQDIQGVYRYLPGELLTYIAKEIGVKEAKAYSVATFYENFSFEQKGKYVIKVCDGTACHVRKSAAILDAFMKELGLSAGCFLAAVFCTYGISVARDPRRKDAVSLWKCEKTPALRCSIFGTDVCFCQLCADRKL